MQTLTFTQKLFRQRGFLRALVPLVALFVGLGASQTAMAQAINTDNLTITAQPTVGPSSTKTFDGTAPDAGATNPLFQGVDLGNGQKFDLASSTLTLDAGLYNVSTTMSRPFGDPAQLLYRVYLVGTSAGQLPTFSSYLLPLTTGATGDPVIFQATTPSVNLLNQPSILGGGTYVLEVIFNAPYTRGGAANNLTDSPNPGVGYKATFKVLAPAITPPNGTSNWISTSSTDWTLAANWSNGVPTQFSDAIIPEKNGTSTNTATPALLDPNPTLYNVRTISFSGTTNATRALLRIGQTTGGTTSGATLNVYGDLNAVGGGLLGSQTGQNGIANPALNSTIALRGNVQQVVRGLIEIADMRIEGSGDKLVVNSVNVANTFVFANGTTAKVRTVSEVFNPADGTSTFTLNTTKTSSVDLKVSGILSGETINAYIEGITLADRNLFAGQIQTFGNIGVDITPNRDILGPTVQITRTVGDPLNGPTTASQPTSGGTVGALPIKRQYGVSGDVNNAPTVSTLVFHYLDSPDELNGNPEANLIIFKTSNNGIPYGIIGGTVNTTANTVTKVGVTAINTITLGDRERPLPVRLTAFNAKRVGTDALVTWATASEENSKGYDVQVSTNGKEFRTLTSVPSAAPNTTRTTEYRYIDTEANKNGTRYYRLRQVDLDGKETFFAPVAVSFTGKSVETALVAYPSPFSGNDQLRLAFQSANAGKGQVLITDLTGRVIRKQSLEVAVGTTDLAIDQLSDLNNGIYMVRLTLPSGQVQNLKVVKQ